jgi:hypothetical protein
MNKRVLIASALFLAAGCGGAQFPTIAGQAQAEQIVWRDLYQMADYTIPSVDWREGKLDCGGGLGWKEPAVGYCVLGTFWRSGWYAEVAFPPDTPISDTAFAHEMAHAKSWSLTGSGDDDHSGPAFQPGGLVDQAVAKLKAAGL